MSKSTPITQLPIAPQQQQIFVNDQQRQMVNQAQQAQQSFQMPQTTSASEMQEDESTVLEVLNQLNNNVQSSMPQPPPPPPMPQMQQQQQHQNMSDLWRDAYSVIPEQQDNMAVQEVSKPVNLVPFLNNHDLMTAIYVVVAVIIVNFVPIDTLIGKYIAIDKIPFSSLALKAVLAGILVLLMQHFLK